MTDRERCLYAARVIADLLASTLMRADDEGRTFLYVWERAGLLWLQRQRAADPATVMNGWTYGRMMAQPIEEKLPEL